jgi:hypothetical protein
VVVKEPWPRVRINQLPEPRGGCASASLRSCLNETAAVCIKTLLASLRYCLHRTWECCAGTHTHTYTTNSCVGVSNAVPSCVLRTGQHRLHAGGGEYQPMTVYLYQSQPHSKWLTVPVKLVLPSRNKDCTHQSRIRTRRRTRGQSAWETCKRCSDGARWQICGKLT